MTTIENEGVLKLRHSDFVGVDVNPIMAAIERIVLEERKPGILVTKVLSIKNHGVLLIFVPICWLVSRFGNPKDPDPSKLMCEAGL